MAARAKLDEVMDELGFQAGPHPDAEALFARIAKHTGVPLTAAAEAFLRRSLCTVDLDVRNDESRFTLLAWEPTLVAEWSWETPNDDWHVSKAVFFGDDAGDFRYFLDPANRIGHGPEAVYVVEAGSMSIDATELVAPDLETMLGHFVRNDLPAQRNVCELRDDETRGRSLPLRLGDGRELPADAVTDPRYFPGLDVLRSVLLTRPLRIEDCLFIPEPDRPHWRTDLSFHPNGVIEHGVLANGDVDDIPIAPRSRVTWLPNGELHAFTPAKRVTYCGVPCRAGEDIVHRTSTGYFVFTPDEDISYRGFPCKAGAKVTDSGRGCGLHFTSARSFQIAGRAKVPPDVEVGILDDGGARFKLVAATILDGRPLPVGTAVWYDGNGNVRELYPRKPQPK